MSRDPPGAADDRNNGPKHLRLDHGANDVPGAQRPPGGLEDDVDADAEDSVSKEGARGEAHEEAEEGEYGKGEAASDDAGGDKVVNRVGAENAEGVGLLGDLHGAELGGEGRTDAASGNDGGDDRGELAGEGEGEDAADGAVEAEAGELADELDGESHANEGGGEEADASGAGSDPLQLLQGVPSVYAPGEGTTGHLPGKNQGREAAPERLGRCPRGEQRSRCGCGRGLRCGFGGVVGDAMGEGEADSAAEDQRPPGYNFGDDLGILRA